MASETGISWTDATFNGWIGCSKVHAGCAHCYAEADMDTRRGRAKWGVNGTRSKTSAANWREPLKWNRKAEEEGVRCRVFCSSLADVFEDWQGEIRNHQGAIVHRCEFGHESSLTSLFANGAECREDCKGILRPITMDDMRRDLFALIDQTPWLDWQLLTKRPENIARMWCSHVNTDGKPPSQLFRENVWLGTSVSDQPTFDKFAHALYHTARKLAPVLFLSMEPLLGPVTLWHDFDGELVRNWKGCFDWVIIGGESGEGARPCDVQWIHSIVQQCTAAELPVFVKQLGAKPVSAAGQLRYLDKKGGDIDTFPNALRVRQFPTTWGPTRKETDGNAA